MALEKKHILITGVPGVGKTTLIKRLYDLLVDFHPAGFFTEEIRERGLRKGFALVSFDGQKGILSHVDINGPQRVGKYGVDIDGFESFLDRLGLRTTLPRVLIIDEIGKMECLSRKFRQLVIDLFESDRVVIATIALKGPELIQQIKNQGDVMLLELTVGNRESIVGEIATLFDLKA